MCFLFFSFAFLSRVFSINVILWNVEYCGGFFEEHISQQRPILVSIHDCLSLRGKKSNVHAFFLDECIVQSAYINKQIKNGEKAAFVSLIH